MRGIVKEARQESLMLTPFVGQRASVPEATRTRARFSSLILMKRTVRSWRILACLAVLESSDEDSGLSCLSCFSCLSGPKSASCDVENVLKHDKGRSCASFSQTSKCTIVEIPSVLTADSDSLTNKIASLV